MPEALELPSLTAAAARAASEDDIARAAALLRQAVELQTSTLGPDHPDVATTLNNLALMLEKLGHVKEAGQCYRRAHAIAAAALGPDDPVVQVSRANLDAFRATYAQPPDSDDGAPLGPTVWGDLGDFPVGAPAAEGVQPSEVSAVNPPVAMASAADAAVKEPVAAAGKPVAAVSAPVAAVDTPVAAANQPTTTAPAASMSLQGKPRPAPPRTKPPEPAPDLPLQFAPATVKVPVSHPAGRYPSGARRSSRAVVIGYLLVGMMLAVLTAWWLNRPQAPIAAGAPAADVTPRAEAPATPAPPTPAPPPATSAAAPPTATASAPTQATTPRPAGAGAVGVTDARLCSALTRARNPWACTAVTSPLAGGAVYYYTRIRATRDVTIRHRWTLDGRVVQDVRLQIRANPTEGFRTFSRQTVSGVGAGAWVVTLLGPDGQTLDEQSFDVR